MNTNSNSDLVQRLKELNALINSHINKVKEDITRLNGALQVKKVQVAQVCVHAVPATEKLAREWREHLN